MHDPSDKGPYMSGVWWLKVVRFRRFAIPIACPEKKKNNNKDSPEKTIKEKNLLIRIVPKFEKTIKRFQCIGIF